MKVRVACSRIGQPLRARCLVDTAVYLARIVLALAAVFAASQRNIYRCPLPILTTTTTRSPTSKDFSYAIVGLGEHVVLEGEHHEVAWFL